MDVGGVRGVRWLTVAGKESVFSLTKVIPGISALAAGTFTGLECQAIGKIAKKVLSTELLAGWTL